MKRSVDVLIGGIMLAVVMAVFTPAKSTSFQFRGKAPAFSETYLLGSQSLEAPSPEAFELMERLGRVLVDQYEVQSQDTLGSLAKKYSSGTEFLRSTAIVLMGLTVIGAGVFVAFYG